MLKKSFLRSNQTKNVKRASHRGPARTRTVRAAIVSLVIIAFIAGCMQNYGRIKKNEGLTTAFTQGQGLPPDYSYYFCGRYYTPWAIVGIKPEYQLKDNMWKKIDTDELLLEQAKRIYYQDRFYAWGADMLDPSGTPIGVYYSTFTSTAIKMLDDNRVEVVCPFRDEPGPSDETFRFGS